MRIQVVPHNIEWPEMYKAEAKFLKAALGDNRVDIHHIGSTSIPGLCAKPKIDIIVVVKDLRTLTPVLEKLGYKSRGELNIPFRLFFTKRGGIPEINLHAFEDGNPEIELNLLFRDFLRTHPIAREEYAELKSALVEQQSSHEKTNAPFSGYNLGKDQFIKKILENAGFNRLCLRFCAHHDEWEAARTFRQKYFFDKVPVSDPYIWTFHHPDHIHFVFYQGVTIIGYAHIQIWPGQRAALRIIVIDELFQNRGMGGSFLKLVECWLTMQGIKKMHIQASPKAYLFYCKHGYTEMPFDDPDDDKVDPCDIPIGKML